MDCFSLIFIEHVLIWLVVIGAFFAILKLLLPHVISPLGTSGSLVVRVIGIVLWAAVIIIVIVIAFDLLGCLAPLR